MGLSVNIIIFLIYIVFLFVILHSIKFRGVYRTLLFLSGMLIITVGIENINVTFGGYSYPHGGFTFLIYRTPIWVWLGWFVILYCSNFASHILIKNGKSSHYVIGMGTKPENGVDKEFIKLTIIRTAFTAYTAILLDLIMDPVGVANNWWTWLVDNIYLHEIPFANYIGWFCVIFFTVFFYEIIITWGSVREKKNTFIAGIWAVASLIAMIFSGLILMGFTFWFGVNGIRTEDRFPLMTLIQTVNVEAIVFTFIIIFITMGITVATSVIPNKLPETRPSKNSWYILPSYLMIGFWVVMMVCAALTSSLLVVVGILDCIPFLIIHLYLIKKRGRV